MITFVDENLTLPGTIADDGILTTQFKYEFTDPNYTPPEIEKLISLLGKIYKDYPSSQFRIREIKYENNLLQSSSYQECTPISVDFGEESYSIGPVWEAEINITWRYNSYEICHAPK